MKILLLNVYADTSVGGGAERINEMLLFALQARGYEMVKLGTAQKPGLTHSIERGVSTWRVGIRNLYWPKLDQDKAHWKRKLWHIFDIYNFPMRSQLKRVLESEKPDLVIMHNLVGWSIAVVDAIHAQKIPMVQVLHDYYNICPNSQMLKKNRNCLRPCVECRLMRTFHRALTNKIDAVIGVSKYILDRHLEHGAYTKVPLRRVIHNVLSSDILCLETTGATRIEARAADHDIGVRFGFIGTISSYKGIENLLEAFVALNEPKAELLIAGIGRPEYILTLSRKFSMPQIKFLGRMLPQDFFAIIDVTVVPSLWQENFPGVILESLAFGVPVIGSRRGGIPEMFVENISGLLFEPNCPDDLQNSLKYFIDHTDEIVRMSSNALAASKPFLNIENWTNSYELIINRVCNTHSDHGVA